jgi:hypothetical protein
MAELTLTNCFEDPVLSNFSQSYKNGQFIADDVAPWFSVDKESGKFYKFGFESFMKNETLRAVSAPANMIAWSPTTGTYDCDEHALADAIADRVINNADDQVSPLITSTQILLDQLLVAREKRVADLLRDTTTLPDSGALGANYKWSNYTSALSVPLENINTAKSAIFNAIWQNPTHIIIPRQVAEVLALHPDILDLVKYTDSTLLTDGGLPKRLRGLTVLEPSAGYTGSEGSTTPTEIWGDDVILLYVNGNPGPKTLNTMMTFFTRRGRVRRWYQEKEEANYIEVSQILDEQIIAVGGAYIINDVL